MTRLLRGATAFLTMDDDGREVAGGDILIDGGTIAAVGRGLAADGGEIVDMPGTVIAPGLVNTHHRPFQTLARAVPAGQDARLFAGGPASTPTSAV